MTLWRGGKHAPPRAAHQRTGLKSENVGGDPLLPNGWGVKTIEFDAIYFFRVENEGFIKRLQRVPGQGLLALSENKSYRDWVIRPDMDFEVFGRVLKLWRGDS